MVLRFALALLVLLPFTLAAQPQVTIGDEEITAAGLTAGGDAILFGISYESREWYTRISRRDRRLTADAGGGLRHNPGGGSQARSTWAVVDLATGASSIVSSAKIGGSESTVPPELLDLLKSEPHRFRAPGELLEILVVQPGVGAWTWSGGDGAAMDRESATGLIEFHAGDLRPLGQSPAPPPLFPVGAKVVVVDLPTLDFLTLQVSR